MRAPLILLAPVLLGWSPAVAAARCEVPDDGDAPVSLLPACKSDLAETEAELAKAYRRLRVETPMEKRTQLGKSQDAWLAYRAAQCSFEGGAKPSGTVAGLACAVRLNRERVSTLEDRLARGE